MTFDSIYATSMDIINGMTYNGYLFTPDMTVCVIISVTGRVYSGVSNVYTDVAGMPVSVHAEINAMNNMTALGEYAIDTLILVGAVNRLALLPCSGCLNYIVSVDQNNMDSFVAIPDRMIRVSEVGAYVQGGMQAGSVHQSVSSESITALGGSSNGDLLKDKLNQLIADNGDEDEDDSEYLEAFGKPKKKKFFGLF